MLSNLFEMSSDVNIKVNMNHHTLMVVVIQSMSEQARNMLVTSQNLQDLL